MAAGTKETLKCQQILEGYIWASTTVWNHWEPQTPGESFSMGPQEVLVRKTGAGMSDRNEGLPPPLCSLTWSKALRCCGTSRKLRSSGFMQRSTISGERRLLLGEGSEWQKLPLRKRQETSPSQPWAVHPGEGARNLPILYARRRNCCWGKRRNISCLLLGEESGDLLGARTWQYTKQRSTATVGSAGMLSPRTAVTLAELSNALSPQKPHIVSTAAVHQAWWTAPAGKMQGALLVSHQK